MTDTFQANPHPVYARWRHSEPVRRTPMPHGREVWLVTRYEDARQALTDPRLSKRSGFGRPDDAVGLALSKHMLAVDPPDHTRLRRLVSTAFTARRIESLRPRIEVLTDELLDAMDGRDRVDFLDAFAFPLPIQVICELLGVPSQDRDAFRAWSTTLVSGGISGETLVDARRQIVEYIRGSIAARRANPGDDLISGLVAVRDDEDRLTEDELTSMVFLLLIAGHETTVNLLGNGAFLLLSERERWERLAADRTLLPSAIEELLRFESPVESATFRVAVEDLEIGGVHIKAGDPVFVVLLSANRDDHFPYADELHLDRPQNSHLAFGHGIHYCLGAPLARLEAQIAFDRLLTRFPGLRLDADVDALAWRPGMLIRGLEKLPVAL
jgi:cytochrome P450